LSSKEDEIKDTINSFFKQFGNSDIYTQIVLEEFFRELFNEKSDLHISSTER
jgi:hypothetical protein